MQRDSFVFYRSFYEAISLMPADVQAEVYTAIVEYALNGKEPKGLSGVARGVFLLVKPNIDASNNRYENGKKCAQYGKLGGRPPKKGKAASSAKDAPPKTRPAANDYSLTLEQEIADMKADHSWNEPVCMQFHLTAEELCSRMDAFLTHCRCEYEGKPHKDYADAKRHFCSWMRKKYPQSETEKADDQLPPPSYGFNGGFGGQDI